MKSAEFKRPGISDEFLAAAGCHHVDENECFRLYGFRVEGIAIPFRTIHGEPILDGAKPFARVRLINPTDDQKYSQRTGSNGHIYNPPGLMDRAKASTLLFVEGEFKALSLDESGYCVVGLCGFSGAARKVEKEDGGPSHELLDDLVQVLNLIEPATIVFAGDSDVVTNSYFAIEAAKLRRLIFGSNRFPFIKKLIVIKPPIDGPKGFDDCREAQKENFNIWFDALLASGLEIEPKASALEVFCNLLQREKLAVQKVLAPQTGDAHRVRVRLLKSAAQLQREAGAMLSLRPLIADVLGVSGSQVPRLIRDASSGRAAKPNTQNKVIGRNSGIKESEQATPNKWLTMKFPLIPKEHGNAIREETDKDGIVFVRDIGEDFLAATLGVSGNPDAPTVFLPTEDKFFSYVPTNGIYVQQRDHGLITRLSRLLLDCARECREGCQTEDLEFRFRDTASLNGVLRKARGLLEIPHDFFSTDLMEYIPCGNGMLRLKDKTLLPFSPSYRRRNKLAVSFDSTAKCPRFLETLMRPALDADELDLLQRWCGLALIGENIAQRILILTGTAGGGKGTFIRVLIGIIGQSNLATLRTQLLGERFELGRFLGKTLLYGADVPEDFLNQRGASVLKSLTGDDPATVELKNSNESPPIGRPLNVIVTCNSRLTVHLEGDVDAWRRRLAIIPYNRSKPENVIADLDKQILRNESSGVLNWMLEGLNKLCADGWQLRLSPKQQTVVDDLLLESDSQGVFARESLRQDVSQSLTVADCFSAYCHYCNQRGWITVTKNRFGALIGDVVVRLFGVTQSHNVLDAGGKPQRGWRGISLKSAPPTGETVSQMSQTQLGDGWDTSSPTQHEKKLVEDFV